MKNRIIMVLLILNLITTMGIMNFFIKGQISKEKVVLKEMTESKQVLEMQTEINNLNKSHDEYANYIKTSKANLATAITSAGVSTSEDDSFETMIANVSNIIINKTGDATAIAEEILKDKTAWVNGEKVTGTMTNNGNWNNTPSAKGQVQIPEGYHDGTGYVDTNTVYTKGYNDGKSQSTHSISLQTWRDSGDVAHCALYIDGVQVFNDTTNGYSGRYSGTF